MAAPDRERLQLERRDAAVPAPAWVTHPVDPTRPQAIATRNVPTRSRAK